MVVRFTPSCRATSDFVIPNTSSSTAMACLCLRRSLGRSASAGQSYLRAGMRSRWRANQAGRERGAPETDSCSDSPSDSPPGTASASGAESQSGIRETPFKAEVSGPSGGETCTMGIVSVSGACPLPLPGDAPLVCLPLVVVIVFNWFLLGKKVKEQTLPEQSLPLSTSIIADLISFA